MKLIPMTTFVLEQARARDARPGHDESEEEFNKCENYAIFLSQELTIGMFVPCNENGNIIEKPIGADCFSDHDMDELLEYEKLKEKILFKNFKLIRKTEYGAIHIGISDNNYFVVYPDEPMREVEWLADLLFEIELTESAIKKFNL